MYPVASQNKQANLNVYPRVPFPQDATASEVQRTIGFDVLSKVQTVHSELASISALDVLGKDH